MAGSNPENLPDIRHVIEINAPIQKVWNAVATSEGIALWLMQNNFQPEIGYEFFLQSPFGHVSCKVLELEPPNRLTFSWDNFGWRVSFELKERNGKTEFTVVHAGWGAPDDTIPRSQQKQSAVHAIMDGGWVHNTQGLRDKISEE